MSIDSCVVFFFPFLGRIWHFCPMLNVTFRTKMPNTAQEHEKNTTHESIDIKFAFIEIFRTIFI